MQYVILKAIQMEQPRFSVVANGVTTYYSTQEQIVEDLPDETVVTADEEDIDYWEENGCDWEEIKYYFHHIFIII